MDDVFGQSLALPLENVSDEDLFDILSQDGAGLFEMDVSHGDVIQKYIDDANGDIKERQEMVGGGDGGTNEEDNDHEASAQTKGEK
jgi:hypothetical protein